MRLAELLENDIRQLYVDSQVATAFPWNEQNFELQVLKSKETAITFNPLLNTEDGKKIPALFEKLESPDGLIVFFHDAKSGFARLKI